MRGAIPEAAVIALVFGAMGLFAPGAVLATPGKDGCTGMLVQPEGDDDRIVVRTPGTRCLDRDLASDQYEDTYTMIEVLADDVTIDCRGHQLTYTGWAPNSRGVATALNGSKRTVVRNCRVRGFGRGIAMHGVQDYLVEDNVVESGRPDEFEHGAGILGFGGGIVQRNRVSGVLNLGIRVSSGYAVVVDNIIDGVTDSGAFGKPVGISHEFPGTAEIRGNTIRRLREDPAYGHGLGTVGVAVEGNVGAGDRVTIADNVLVHDASSGSVAFECAAGAPVRYADNVVSGFATTNAGCIDAGDNDVTP